MYKDSPGLPRWVRLACLAALGLASWMLMQPDGDASRGPDDRRPSATTIDAVDRPHRFIATPARVATHPGPARAIRLQGIVQRPDSPGGSLALITDGGTASLFPVGADLGAGRVLAAIGADHVVVADDDGRRTLTLDAPARPAPTPSPFMPAPPTRLLMAVEKLPRLPPLDADGRAIEPPLDAN